VGRQHQCCYLGEQILFEINGWLSKFSFSWFSSGHQCQVDCRNW
jgi:hypothetical protein